ncbi:ABC transporter ATP-binding protein [Nocardioides alcanivorans]|uniref:ABC transporter ATP-binding protein n=1 Tax=Nocardioides alcanivorans TaxID=2897352 RepID=UPI00289F398C|nr:ABC transporter ATP-binding protein [Nocardioides alcanivorans]
MVGPNACGKSTLLKSLARVLTPSAGRILLDGKEIQRHRSKDVARRIGLLPRARSALTGSGSPISSPAAGNRTTVHCASGAVPTTSRSALRWRPPTSPT